MLAVMNKDVRTITDSQTKSNVNYTGGWRREAVQNTEGVFDTFVRTSCRVQCLGLRGYGRQVCWCGRDECLDTFFCLKRFHGQTRIVWTEILVCWIPPVLLKSSWKIDFNLQFYGRTVSRTSFDLVVTNLSRQGNRIIVTLMSSHQDHLFCLIFEMMSYERAICCADYSDALRVIL